MALASVVLLSTMLASTDAALGQKVVTDPVGAGSRAAGARRRERAQRRPRRPVLLRCARRRQRRARDGRHLGGRQQRRRPDRLGARRRARRGHAGGLLFRFADRRKWIGGEWRQIVPLAVALLAYAARGDARRQWLHRRLRRRHGVRMGLGRTRLGRHVVHGGGRRLVAAVTWIGFGALALTLALPHVTWQVVLYAALSLTVVRMVPVAIALAGRGSGGRRWRSSAGSALAGSPRSCSHCSRSNGVCPRRSRADHRRRHRRPERRAAWPDLVTLVTAYHRWYDAHTRANPEAEEATPTAVPRRRRQLDAAGLGRPGGRTPAD